MTNLCAQLKQKSRQRQKTLFLAEIAVIAVFLKSLAEDVCLRDVNTLLQNAYPSQLANYCTSRCTLFLVTS